MKRVLAILLTVVMLLGMIPAAYADEPGGSGSGDPIIIDPTAYGADPSGATDSAEAIWEAFEAAKTLGNHGETPVVIRFPKGEYHLYKEHMQQREWHTSNTSSTDAAYHNKYIGLLLQEQRNVTVDGQDSLFMMHGDVMAFCVAYSENITVKNLSWDYFVPTISEMVVLDAQDSYVDYYIPAAFPYTISGSTIRWSGGNNLSGQEYWTETGIHNGAYSVITYNPEEEMTRAYFTSQGPFQSVTSIQQREGRVVRFNYSSSKATRTSHGIVNGAVFQYATSSVRPSAGGFNWESSTLLFQNVKCHSTHGFGWLTQMCRDVTYDHCDFLPREGAGRFTTSYADGLHASGSAGYFKILNCNFANTHDDPINMHGTFTQPSAKNGKTLTLQYKHNQQGGFPQFHVGDKAQIFTRSTLVPVGGENAFYTVASVVNPGEGGNNLKTMQVTFEEELPEMSTLSNYVVENVTYAPSVTIENCTFKGVNTRGILVTTRNPIIIRNNLFLNMSMATIFLSNDSGDWYESGPIRNMTIEGNTFYIKSLGRTSWPYAPAIYVHPVTQGAIGQPSPTQTHPSIPDPDNAIHQNITINNNTFYMDNDCVVNAESVKGLTITNNRIYRYSPNVSLTLADDLSVGVGRTADIGLTATGKQNKGLAGKDVTANNQYDNLFVLDKCKDVTISGNTYDDGLKTVVVNHNSASVNVQITDPELEETTSLTTAADPAVAGVRYAVSDPTVASVDANGTVTGLKAGEVQVYAYYDLNGSLVKSNTVTVTVSESAPPQMEWVKAEGVSVAGTNREDDTHWARKSATSIGITQQAGDIWQNDTNSNNAKNIFLFDLPSGASGDDVIAAVHASGLPAKASSDWDSANLLLYVDDDHYAGIGKKAHMNGYSSMIEAAGNDFGENAGSEDNNAHTDATLLIWKSGSTIRFFAKPDNGEWTETAAPNKTLTGTPKVGIGAWGDNSPEEIVFSDVRIGKASEVTLGANAAASASALDGFLSGTDVTPIFKQQAVGGGSEPDPGEPGAPAMEWVKADGVSIASENSEAYTHEGANDITITPASGGMWQGDGTDVPNLVNLTLGSGPLAAASDTDVTVAVDITGMPARVSANNNWDAAGLVLYKDLDNYIFVGKQAHKDGIMVIKEIGRSGGEQSGNASHNDKTAATLVLHKSGNTVRAFYKVDGVWGETAMPSSPSGNLPSGLKVGLAAWNGVIANSAKYENLRVGAAVNLGADLNSAGAALDAFIASTDPTPLFKQQPVGSGGSGEPETVASGTLGGISVDGALVKNFAAATKSYTVTVPAVDKVRLGYIAAEGEDVTVTGATVEEGVVALSGAETTLTLTPGGGAAYTLTLKKVAASNDATLSAFTASGLTLSAVSTNKVGAKTVYAQATGSVTSTTLTVTPANENATVVLTRDCGRTPVELTEGSATVPLYPGLNSFYADVTAADGAATQRYIMNIVRVAKTDADLSGISLGGTPVEGFAAATTQYAVKVAGGTALTVTPADANASVTIWDGATLTEGATATIPSGTERVDVVVRGEDPSAMKVYTLSVVETDPTDARLLSMSLTGGTLSPVFDSAVTDYTAEADGASATLQVATRQEDATVAITAGSQTQSGTRTASLTFNPAQVGGAVTVTVTSADESATKTYTIDILTKVPLATMAAKAKSNSQMTTPDGNDGPASWAFDTEDHWWHTCWNSGQVTSTNIEGHPSTATPIWIQTGFGAAVPVQKITYLPRGDQAEYNIKDYELQLACLDDPDDEPAEEDFVTVKTGTLPNNYTVAQAIEPDTVWTATHMRIVVTSVYNSEGSANTNYLTAKRIEVYTGGVGENLNRWFTAEGAYTPGAECSVTVTCPNATAQTPCTFIAAYYNGSALADVSVQTLTGRVTDITLSTEVTCTRVKVFVLDSDRAPVDEAVTLYPAPTT